MLGVRGHEDRLPRGDGERGALDREDAAPLEDDVDLVVVVRLLPVGLGRHEHVDAELEPRRRVDDLVAAAGRLEPRPDLLDLERVRGRDHRRGCSSARLPFRVVSSTCQTTLDATETTPGTRATSRSSSSTSLRVCSLPSSRTAPRLTSTVDLAGVDPHRPLQHVLLDLLLDLLVARA